MKLFTRKQKNLINLLKDYEPYCTHCEASIIPDSNSEYPVKYCSECGQELLQPFLCLFCGCPVSSESKYCTGCGIIAIRGDK